MPYPLSGWLQRHSSSDELNRETVILILPHGYPFYPHRPYPKNSSSYNMKDRRVSSRSLSALSNDNKYSVCMKIRQLVKGCE